MTADSHWAQLEEDAAALVAVFRATGLRIAAAESCTGGLIAAVLTAVPGSSDVFERGFVTYSNEAKMECLDVPAAVLDRDGAVSHETAAAMARGALARSHADVSVAVTGIAGPGGGTETKPVGLVYLAAARRDREPMVREMRYGDLGRAGVRMATVATALQMLKTQSGV